MTGTVKKVLDQIISVRSNGNPTLEKTTRTKLILKGLNPDQYTLQSEDDPSIVAKAYTAAKEMGIEINNFI